MRRSLLLLLLLLGVAACRSSPRHPLDSGPPGDGDAGPPADDPCAECAAGEVCDHGACVAVPDSCPCPLGSYCDLDRDTCIVGCTVDDHCAPGTFCDGDQRMCRPGCRGDGECPAEHACTDHACVDVCAGVTCPDDGDPCTRSFCRGGECAVEDVADGGGCPDDGDPCTDDECRSGECAHPARPPGSACAGDGNPCTDDVCQAGGCAHPFAPDLTPCSGGLCLGGACAGSVATCRYDGSTGYWILTPAEGDAYYVTDCFCTTYDGGPWLFTSYYDYPCPTDCFESAPGEYLCL